MLFGRMRADRAKKWGLGLALFIAPAAIYTGWMGLSRWRAKAFARDAVSALSYCLMGPVALDDADPEAAARQLRGVAIGGDLSRDGAWPGRCEGYLRSSERALTHLYARAAAACEGSCCQDDVRCLAILELQQEVGRARDYLAIGEKSAFDADAFVRHATELQLLSGASEGAPEPPEPPTMLDHRRMRPLYEGDYLRLLTDPAGDNSLSLLFYEQDRQYGLCHIALGEGVAARAGCSALPDSIPVGMAGELLASESGAPASMYAQGKAGGGWVQALYDVKSGAELSRVADRPVGGFVWESGTVAHLAAGPPLTLNRVRHGVAEEPVPLAIGGDVSSGPRLIWDEIVWAEPAPERRHRVMARRALDGDEPLGERVDIGLTPPLTQPPSIELCRTDEVLALLVGANDNKGGIDAALLFRDAAGWKTPTEVRLDTMRFGFTCRGDTATLSWIVGVEELPDLSFLGEVDTEASLPVGGRYSVHRLRCADGHCKHDQTMLPLRRFSKSSRYVAGDAGDAMIVLWRSVLGDVRLKFGALEALADAPERAVFDDVEHDGFGWDLEGDPIIGRSGSVLVLLSRQIDTKLESSTYGFVIDPGGAVSPMEVATGAL